jgi:hypothetical protein
MQVAAQFAGHAAVAEMVTVANRHGPDARGTAA